MVPLSEVNPPDATTTTTSTVRMNTVLALVREGSALREDAIVDSGLNRVGGERKRDRTDSVSNGTLSGVHDEPDVS